MRHIPGQSSGLQLATLLTAAQTNKASQDTAKAEEGFVFHCSVFMFLSFTHKNSLLFTRCGKLLLSVPLF